MHIFFSGIGGAGIAPLALVAKQAGYEVSGSDKQTGSYFAYLKDHGIEKIMVGQSYDQISKIHSDRPIDWFVYSSALTLENPDAEELKFCKEHGIKTSKRDEFLNNILKNKRLKLLAVAGTHGKTTTTAMTVWLFKSLELPISYILPAKVSYGDMGEYDQLSEYFIYECDEFDRNFLAFDPHISLISGVSWDHHEIFPTRKDYQEAFKQFIGQSELSFTWQTDADYLSLKANSSLTILQAKDFERAEKYITLVGHYNRMDAWLAIHGVQEITNRPTKELVEIINHFPGLQRRMEKIVPNLYSDYAHTPEKIRAAMSAALEMAESTHQDVVVVYEPLTNRRQHYMKADYKDCFKGAKKVYWTASYLAREDPKQPVLSPTELIQHLADPSLAEARERNDELEKTIREHLDHGDIVVGMAGGGGGSLDDWLRERFH